MRLGVAADRAPGHEAVGVWADRQPGDELDDELPLEDALLLDDVPAAHTPAMHVPPGQAVPSG